MHIGPIRMLQISQTWMPEPRQYW